MVASLPAAVRVTPQDGPPKNLKEFNLQWKKSRGDAARRYAVLRSMGTEGLNEVFKTELDSDTLCEIVQAFSLHQFAGSAQDMRHAVEFLNKVGAYPVCVDARREGCCIPQRKMFRMVRPRLPEHRHSPNK